MLQICLKVFFCSNHVHFVALVLVTTKLHLHATKTFGQHEVLFTWVVASWTNPCFIGKQRRIMCAKSSEGLSSRIVYKCHDPNECDLGMFEA